MIAILQLTAYLCLSCMLALHWQDNLIQVFPVSTALLIVTLYVLSLFRFFTAINYLAVLVIVLFIINLLRNRGMGMLHKVFKLVTAPQMISVFIMMILAWYLFRNLEFTNRDDFGCWAAEAKSILYYGGFSPKYKNAAVSFGNYFPGTTLFRCWVCRMADCYKGGLLVVGSAWLFIFLIAPFLDSFDFSLTLSPVVGLIGGIFLLFLPGVFDLMTYQSICAEPLMSAAFAGLWAVLLGRKSRTSFPQLLSYGFLLCFFKSSGILFALSVLIYFLVNRKNRIADSAVLSSLEPTQVVKGALLCILPAIIWLVYCVFMARNNYFSVALRPAETGTYSFAAYSRSLLLGLFTVPAHCTSDGLLNLPFAVLIVLNALLWYVAKVLGLFSEQRLKSLLIYYAIILAAILISILFLHSFVFREELYTEPDAMMMSVARYSQPILLAPILLLFSRVAANGSRRPRMLLLGSVMALVMSCTCFWTVYYRVINSKQCIEQALNMYSSVEETCSPFLSLVRQEEPGRIVYVYGDTLNLQDTARTCLQYLASPSSIVLCEVESNEDRRLEEQQRVSMLLDSSHADWLYISSELPDEFCDHIYLDFQIESGKLIPLH